MSRIKALWMQGIRKKRNRGGFTLVEMMAAVAILIILMGLSFVAVIQYQRDLKLLEMDRTAKELFIAAQNHLTTAELDGSLLRLSENEADRKLGYPVSGEEGNYFVLVNSSLGTTDPVSADIFDLMLPFGAIDETVRLGGSYILKYDLPAATVTDVFYAEKSGSTQRFRYDFALNTDITSAGTSYSWSSDLSAARGTEDTQKKNRKNFPKGVNSAVIGFYGGTAETIEKTTLQEAKLQVINGAKLYALVDDTNAVAKATDTNDESQQANTAGSVETKLYIEGALSGAKASIALKKTGNARNVFPTDSGYLVVLDDIVSVSGSYGTDRNLHFASLFAGETVTGIEKDKAFIPGEDIQLYTEVSDNTRIANIPRSTVVTVNSLFGARVTQESAVGDDVTSTLQYLTTENIRHLENLDGAISGFVPSGNSSYFMVNSSVKVQQSGDISFTEFVQDHAGIHQRMSGWTTTVNEKNVVISSYQGETTRANTTAGIFLPLQLSYPLQYDGSFTGSSAGNSTKTDSYERSSYKISDITIDTKTSSDTKKTAGLFGTISQSTTISNLILENFDVLSTSHAGALAGEIGSGVEVKIQGVLAKSYDFATYGVKQGSTAAEALEKREIASEGGSTVGVGGLLGTNAGTLSIQDSGAGMYVYTNNGNAGGLLGSAAGGSVSIVRSYAAGHTLNGKYREVLGKSATKDISGENITTAQGRLNVVSLNGNAAGFVGNIGGGSFTVTNSYTTTSQYGGTFAGGFLGNMGGNQSWTVTNSYAAGLTMSKDGVDQANGTYTGGYVGGFTARAGAQSASDTTTCYYLSGNMKGGKQVSPMLGQAVSYVEPLKDGETESDEQKAKRALSEKIFSGATYAYPYDSYLRTHYNAKYSLKTVAELAADSSLTAYFLRRHVGDWELFEEEDEEVQLMLHFDNREILTAVIVQPLEKVNESTETIKFALLDPETYDAEKGLTADNLTRDLYEITVTELNKTAKTAKASITSAKDKTDTPRIDARVFMDKDDYYLALRVYLDDITERGGHFANLSNITPGQDILGYVYTTQEGTAEQYETKLNDAERRVLYRALREIADTQEVTDSEVDSLLPKVQYSYWDITNSLFAYAGEVDTTERIAGSKNPKAGNTVHYITNMRHLQNADLSVSNLDNMGETGAAIPTKHQNKDEGYFLEQKADINAAVFYDAVDSYTSAYKNHAVYPYAENSAVSYENAFYGIENLLANTYNGNGHSIANLKIAFPDYDQMQNAGLFRCLQDGKDSDKTVAGWKAKRLYIDNLIVQNPMIVGKNAGVLVGSHEGDNGLDIQNVLIENPRVYAQNHAGGMVGRQYNSGTGIHLGITYSEVRSIEDDSTKDSQMLIYSAGGSAGMDQSGENVKDGSAGGLIGSVSSGNLTLTNTAVYGKTSVIVTAGSGNSNKTTNDCAGGLIGTFTGAATVSSSASAAYVYAANGDSVGGLFGEFVVRKIFKEDRPESIIENCYVAGHTENTQYENVRAFDIDKAAVLKAGETITIENKDGYNVYGQLSAGGLIGYYGGSAARTIIRDTFVTASTCTFETAGINHTVSGFISLVGNNSKLELSGNYAAGRVYPEGNVAVPTDRQKEGSYRGGFIGYSDGNIFSGENPNYCVTNMNYHTNERMIAAPDNTGLNLSAISYRELAESAKEKGATAAATVRFDGDVDYELPIYTLLHAPEEIGKKRGGAEERRLYGDWEILQSNFGVIYYEKVQHGLDPNNFHYYYHGYMGDLTDNGGFSQDYHEVFTGDTLPASLTGRRYNSHELLVDHNEYVVEEGYLLLGKNSYFEAMEQKMAASPADYEDILIRIGTQGRDRNAAILSNDDKATFAKRYDGIAEALGYPGFRAYVIDPSLYITNYGGSQGKSVQQLTIERCSMTNKNLVGEKEPITSTVFYVAPIFSDTLYPTLEKTDNNAYSIRSYMQLSRMLNKFAWAFENQNITITQTMDLHFDGSRVPIYDATTTGTAVRQENLIHSFSQGTFSALFQSSTPEIELKDPSEREGQRNLLTLGDAANFYSMDSMVQPLIAGGQGVNRNMRNLYVKNSNASKFIIGIQNGGVVENCLFENVSFSNDVIDQMYGGATFKNSHFKTVKTRMITGSIAANATIDSVYIYANSEFTGEGAMTNQNDGTIMNCRIDNSTMSGNGMVNKNNSVSSKITGGMDGENGIITIYRCTIAGAGVANSNAGFIDGVKLDYCQITGSGIAETNSGTIQNNINNATVDHCNIGGDGIVTKNSGTISNVVLWNSQAYFNAKIGRNGIVGENAYGAKIYDTKIYASDIPNGAGFVGTNDGTIGVLSPDGTASQGSSVNQCTISTGAGFVNANNYNGSIYGSSVGDHSIVSNGAGFVESNKGIIDGCGVGSNGSEIHGAGFADINYREIRNSNSNAYRVYGDGFIRSNEGGAKITACRVFYDDHYTDANENILVPVISGNGFVGVNNQNATIQTSVVDELVQVNGNPFAGANYGTIN